MLGLGKHPSDSASHNNTILTISNDEMKEIIEIVKSVENWGLLFKGVGVTTQNEAKEQKAGFISLLLGRLGASLLGNILAGKGIHRAGEGMIRAVYRNKKVKKQQQKD